MGTFTGFTCPHCFKDIELLEGIGFFYSSFLMNDLEEICKCIKSKRIIKEVKDLYTNYNAKLYENSMDDRENNENKYNFGMKIYYSARTKKIYNLLYFELEYEVNGEKRIYRPIFKDRYGDELIEIDHSEILMYEIRCPKCNNIISNDDSYKILFRFGFWD